MLLTTVPAVYDPPSAVYSGLNGDHFDCATTAAVNIVARIDGTPAESVAYVNALALNDFFAIAGSKDALGITADQLFAFWHVTPILGATLERAVPVADTKEATRWAIWHYGALFRTVMTGFTGHAEAVVGYSKANVYIETWGHRLAIPWTAYLATTTNAWAIVLSRS